MLEDLPVSLMDIIVLVVVLLSALLAAVRGFVREVLSIVAWVGAALIAVYGYPHARPYAQQLTDIQLFADAGTGVVLFVVSLGVLSIVSRYLSSGVKESAVGSLDRSLGFLFGIARGVLFLCLIYIGATMIWVEKDLPASVVNSKTYPPIKNAAEKLLSLAPEAIKTQRESAGNDVRQTIEDANEAKRLYDTLNKPLPLQADKPATEQSYSDEDRSRLNSLIEDSQ